MVNNMSGVINAINKREICQTFNYDRTHDILYISLKQENAIGDEISNGFVVRKNPDTNEIVGITILDFMKKFASRTKENKG